MVVNDLVTAAWKVTQLNLVKWSCRILPCCEQKFTYAASLWWLRYQNIFCNCILGRSQVWLIYTTQLKSNDTFRSVTQPLARILCSLWEESFHDQTEGMEIASVFYIWEGKYNSQTIFAKFYFPVKPGGEGERSWN